MATTTATLGQTAIDEKAIDAFRGQLRGSLIQPGDDGYDEARIIWNVMIDKHPAFIAQLQQARASAHG